MSSNLDKLASAIVKLVEGKFKVSFDENIDGSIMIQLSLAGLTVQREVQKSDNIMDWIYVLDSLYQKLKVLNNPICKSVSADGVIELQSPEGNTFYIEKIINHCAYVNADSLKSTEAADLACRLLLPYDDYYEFARQLEFSKVELQWNGRTTTISKCTDEVPPSKSVVLGAMFHSTVETCLNELENNQNGVDQNEL